MNSLPNEFDHDHEDLPEWISHYLIEDILGEGAFGRVYLALDTRLDRRVALKIFDASADSEFRWEGLWRREARVLAALDHPNIVPVFDAGQADSGESYIVSKYIEGETLAERLHRESCPVIEEGVKILVSIARALQRAHDYQLVHRDVKPGNIMIDEFGHPYLIDFGLTLIQENLGRGPDCRLGTPPYMSPEQARGEANLVSGRSDVFSLGVILYEILTGKVPFDGDLEAMLKGIEFGEFLPPSALNPEVPSELETLCLSALSRLPGDRPEAAGSPSSFEKRLERSIAPVRKESGVQAQPELATPKGLHCFDEEDASFFLNLLPGPRDYTGLPISVARWKSRIEASEPDKTFRVGVVYGNSGSGKSSLVRGGVIPQLDPSVIPIFVEAEWNTEEKLVRALHHRFPRLDGEENLCDILRRLRDGEGAPVGCKVLLVVDQFEQYIHREDLTGGVLLQGLRYCDGVRLLALTIVRDDFWVGISKVFSELSIDIDTGKNAGVVDLFDRSHAENVLIQFGRSLRAFPVEPGKLDRVQARFVKLAIKELSEGGRVMPLKIALFAEMFKSRPWTPAELQRVGGMSGLGVLYLDECFSKRLSGQEGKRVTRLAEKILEALLPKSTASIKGRALTWDELRNASGFSEDSREFDDLFFLLTREFRLLSPVQGSGVDEDSKYGLAHDYLVPSVRRWLDGRKMETWAGRAELRLRESLDRWITTRNSRFLPNAFEWWQIRFFTSRARWTDEERELMKRGGRKSLIHMIAVAVIAVALGMTLFEIKGRIAAKQVFARIFLGGIEVVPELKPEIRKSQKWLVPMLHGVVRNREPDDPDVLCAEAALNQLDLSDQLSLVRFLMKVPPSEFAGFCASILPLEPECLEYLEESAADNPNTEAGFRARIALFATNSGGEVESLVDEWLQLEPDEVFRWAEVMLSFGDPVKQAVNEALKPVPEDISRNTLTYIYAVKKSAKAALAYLGVGDSSKVRYMLSNIQRSDERTYLIEYLKPSNIGSYDFWATSEFWGKQHVLAGFLQAIAEVDWKDLPAAKREAIMTKVLGAYRSPTAEIHSSAKYALRRWGQTIPKTTDGESRESYGWFVADNGFEFAVLSPYRGRLMAVSTAEITRGDYLKYMPPPDAGEESLNRFSSDESPMVFVSAVDIAKYCNALSELEGLESCYVEKGGRWYLQADFEERSGYRMPTVSEWRFACKGEVKSYYYFGYATELLYRHVQTNGDSANPVLTSEMKRPNSFGVFDMLGNAPEWLHRDRRLTEPLDSNAYASGGGDLPVPGSAYNDILFLETMQGDSCQFAGIRLFRNLGLPGVGVNK